jgi:hypothetical protein
MDPELILDKLVVMDRKLDLLHDKVDRVNGTVQAHSAWIGARIELCKVHLAKTTSLASTSSGMHDYQIRQQGGLAAGRMLLAALWAVTLAIAAAIGAWFGRMHIAVIPP